MNTHSEAFSINPEHSRFELHLAQQRAELNFNKDKNTYILKRVFTPPQLRGQGIAAKITAASLAWIKQNNHTIIPVCPYIVNYIKKHPEWETLIYKAPTNTLYSFRDDYSEGCHPNILAALTDTNLVQQNAYGNDEYSDAARRLIQTECHSEPAIFFVAGGTLANLIIHSALLRPHEAVIAVNDGHINLHETGAIEATGHKVITCKGHNGKLYPNDIQILLDEYALAPHMVKPRMVYISNATESGTIYNKAELTELSLFCKAHHLFLMLDGARLGSALVSQKNDLSLADIAKLTDVFWIGGTKMGAMLSEAIVINNLSLAEDFEFFIKQRGALTAKGRMHGIQFRELFKDSLYFKLAATTNQHAQRLADGIQAKGFSLVSELESNQVFPILPNTLIQQLEQDFKFYIWKKHDEASSVIRLVTSWATQAEQVERFIDRL